MVDLVKMPEAELVELYNLWKAEWERARRALKDAGRGHETAVQIAQKAAAGGDPLAERYVLAYGRFRRVSNQCEARRFERGTFGPIHVERSND